MWLHPKSISFSIDNKHHIFRCSSYPHHCHFPIQKSLNIMSKISSTPTWPVILPSCCKASRRCSALTTRSPSKLTFDMASTQRLR
ncbi:hypothetical protein HOLleu_40906 [Holothuria leucospilota]|uniref:Uncharacterized protein n=1 Tax=Holothuria leucospilota TaxID=206669 RepID=A0A9Q1BAV1_HOLLE|nr:hypothetical protein HOLleu_40906 [Holothuria leucospilota]